LSVTSKNVRDPCEDSRVRREYAIPDLSGWEAYCDTCGTFRQMRRAQERDVSDRSEYFEFVRTVCHSIAFTIQRANAAERLNEVSEN